MSLQNNWVTYTARTYSSIKAGIVSKLGIQVPEITDHSENNVFVKLISIFAGLGEQLHYYIDNMLRESRITTTRRYSSMVSHAKLFDYRIKAAIPAHTDITLIFKDGNDDPVAATSNYVIPRGTAFTTSNSIQFLSTRDVSVHVGATSVIIPAEQKTAVSNQTLGTSNGTANQAFSLPNGYVHGSIEMTINNETWTEQSTLGRSGSTDKHFIVDITETGTAIVTFGNGTNGAIPPNGIIIPVDYHITQMEAGNVLAETISSTTFAGTIPGVTSVTPINYNDAVGGYRYEGLNDIRENLPLSLRTLERAVTKQDYIDLTKLASGVDKANLSYSCGQNVKIYITPIGGGIAQQALIEATKDHMDNYRIISTMVDVYAAGETYVKLGISIRGKFRIPSNTISTAVKGLLTDAYSYANSDVNKSIRLSDIIAIVDNSDKVDYLTVTNLSTQPYARPRNHNTQLVWDCEVLSGNTNRNFWKLELTGSQFNLYKNGLKLGTYSPDVTYTDPTGALTFTITNQAYGTGKIWEFITYPYNKDIELDDNTIPVVRESDITLTITENVNKFN